MTIWIATILFFAVGGAIGFVLGAVRAAVCLVGLLIGAFLTAPWGIKAAGWILDHLGLGWLLGKVGLNMQGPFMTFFVPPYLFLFLVGLVALGISFALYLPIAKYYRLKAGDYHRRAWQRLDQRLGVLPGALSGMVLLLVGAVCVYSIGYVVVTFAKEEGESKSIRLLATLRKDMVSSGLDRIVAPLDPMPRSVPKFYDAVDLSGFVYYNLPRIRERVSTYPPIYALMEFGVQLIPEDREYQNLLNRKPPLTELMENPTAMIWFVTIFASEELMKIDAKDLRTYLESGKSPKYDPYPILGRWHLDVEQVLLEAKKAKPDIKPAEMAVTRTLLLLTLSGTYLKVFPENKLALVVQGASPAEMAQVTPAMMEQMTKYIAEQMKQAMAASMTARPTPQAQAPGSSRGRLSGSEGLPTGRRRSGAPPPVQPDSPTPPQQAPQFRPETRTVQGTWEGEGDNYLVKLPNPLGGEQDVIARITGDEMVFSYAGQKMVFVKQ
jgi:hypothetical protein